mmetsp:Transcript_48717/g.71202  ORF Transcript_48717/g.71202 Transcript_48717/m.71202 type:complete len:258 (+) Transcript_48717:175-948(+)
MGGEGSATLVRGEGSATLLRALPVSASRVGASASPPSPLFLSDDPALVVPSKVLTQAWPGMPRTKSFRRPATPKDPRENGMGLGVFELVAACNDFFLLLLLAFLGLAVAAAVAARRPSHGGGVGVDRALLASVRPTAGSVAASPLSGEPSANAESPRSPVGAMSSCISNPPPLPLLRSKPLPAAGRAALLSMPLPAPSTPALACPSLRGESARPTPEVSSAGRGRVRASSVLGRRMVSLNASGCCSRGSKASSWSSV